MQRVKLEKRKKKEERKIFIFRCTLQFLVTIVTLGNWLNDFWKSQERRSVPKMNLEPPWTNVAFLFDENIRKTKFMQLWNFIYSIVCKSRGNNFPSFQIPRWSTIMKGSLTGFSKKTIFISNVSKVVFTMRLYRGVCQLFVACLPFICMFANMFVKRSSLRQSSCKHGDTHRQA